jgi:outer membrane protein
MSTIVRRAAALMPLAAALALGGAAPALAESGNGSGFAVAGDAWASPELPAEGGAAATGAARDNTLAGVYDLALRSDPVLAAAEATWRAGREEKRIALAGLLPQVQGTYGIADIDQESSGAFAAGSQIIPNNTESQIDSDDWSLSLNQPLFDLGAWFNFRRGSELSEQAQATFTQAQQDLIVRVVGTYFDVLRAGANLSAANAQEDALEGQLDQVRQRFEVGLVAITDVLDAEAAYDSAVADRIAAAAALDVALESLSVITGQEHAQLWELAEAFPVVDPTPDSMDAWVDFALENNVDLDVAELGRDASLAAARATASAHLPTVNLSLQRTSSESDIDQDDLVAATSSRFERNQDQDFIGLELSVPLFSGGRISAQRRQAYARYDSSARNLEATRRNVTQATRALYINVKRDVARTRARARSIESARSALEAAQTGYEVGTRNVVDVLNAQRALFSAIRDHDNSIVDFVQDVIALKRQAGILTPADVIELDRWLREPEPPTASSRMTAPRGSGATAG